jgi:hypothetical protein
MTAWFLYLLQGDEKAGAALLREDAETLSSSNRQDIANNQ